MWGISILADFRPMGLRNNISVSEKKNTKPSEVQIFCNLLKKNKQQQIERK